LLSTSISLGRMTDVPMRGPGVLNNIKFRGSLLSCRRFAVYEE